MYNDLCCLDSVHLPSNSSQKSSDSSASVPKKNKTSSRFRLFKKKTKSSPDNKTSSRGTWPKLDHPGSDSNLVTGI